MAQTSRPWAGNSTGDAGPYTDVQWQALYEAALGFGNGPNDGVFLGSNSADLSKRGLDVEANAPAAANVLVRPGSALVDGVVFISTATETLSIAANASGNPRIDSIILRKDTAAQTVRLAVKQGTPAATPAPPTLTQTTATYEIGIGDISVANGFAVINAADVQPTANPKNAPDALYHYGVLNNSGQTLKTGDVVIWDTGTVRAVTTTTTENNRLRAGVWVGTTPTGSRGRVQYYGLGLVRVSAAAALGARLVTSPTAKNARVLAAVTPITNPFLYSLGIVMQAAGAAGLTLAFIDCTGQEPQPAYGEQMLGGLSTASVTYVTLATVTITLTGLPLYANINLVYRDLGVIVPNFNLLQVSIFEGGVNAAPEWGGGGGGVRLMWQECNEARRTLSGMYRRSPIRVPGSVTFTLEWRISAGTVTADEIGFKVFEQA